MEGVNSWQLLSGRQAQVKGPECLGGDQLPQKHDHEGVLRGLPQKVITQLHGCGYEIRTNILPQQSYIPMHANLGSHYDHDFLPWFLP